MKQLDVVFRKGPPERWSELYLTQEQCSQFMVLNHERIQLQFGQRCKPVQVFMVQNQDTGVVQCSQDILEDLLIPESVTLPLFLEPNKRILIIGPVVGILANVHWKQVTGIHGEQEKVFRKLLDAAHLEQVFGYVLSPLEIDWSKDFAWGYFYQQKNETGSEWKRTKLPLPNVIYNQISSRKFEKRPQVQEAIKRLRNLLAHRFFNPEYFDKWQVHRWLLKDAATAEYVPESMRVTKAASIAALLQRYGSVYLKPIHGSLGIGILKLTQLPDGRIQYQLKQKSSIVQGYAKGVAQALKLAISGKKVRYMIQRGLPLMTYKGRPFDLRVLVQKDGEGKWSRTKLFARIAKQGDFTSNLTTGGDAKPIRELLQELIHDQAKVNQIMKDVKTCIKLIPASIERQSDSILGELGLDLGIDMNGKVWVIEVNAKPWKKTETVHGNPVLVDRAFQRPMAFARYLAMSDLEPTVTTQT
jgi:glutathione synthase/RimK-type ligase-like ATP-grasp enzyme